MKKTKDLKHKHLREIYKNQFDHLLDDKPNDKPFSCELKGYFLAAINQNITFIAYPNGERKTLHQVEKTLFFENPRFALAVFHYEVERDLLLKN